MKKFLGFLGWLVAGVVAWIIALGNIQKSDGVEDGKKKAANRAKDNDNYVDSYVADIIQQSRRSNN